MKIHLLLAHNSCARYSQFRSPILAISFLYGYYRVYSDQDRQCTCNVTLWRVRITIVVLETQQCVLCVLLRNMLLSAVLKY